MAFLADLKEGEEAEKLVASLIEEEWGLRLSKNENKRGVDLVSPIMSVEVKWDRRVEETGNTFIEISSKRAEGDKTPSGLFAEFDIEPTLFAIGCATEVAVFNTRHLREKVIEWAADGVFRLCNGGDGWKSRGILANWSILKEEAIKVFTI